jgi:hypothetical protein
MKRALTAIERRQLQPTIDWLMSERGHALTEASALDVVTSPEKSLRFIEGQFGRVAARRKAFAEGKLSPEQEHALKLSDARTIPSTSIQLVRPTRGVAPVTPEASRQPGEPLLAWQKRIRQQILDLGKPANIATGKPDASAARSSSGFTATPQGSSPSPGNESFNEIKARLLSNESLTVREIVAHGAPVNQPDTSRELDAALRLMKSRGQSTNVKAATFRENYRAALLEGGK